MAGIRNPTQLFAFVDGRNAPQAGLERMRADPE